MPTSARKSSLGTSRRVAPKAHVPFRADDFEHGKRTGLAVNYIARRSDDFEAFDQVISQADAVTPPKVKGNGKKKKHPLSPVDDEDEDENGEMSMELVDSNPPTPVAYFANARAPLAPSSIRRVGSSSMLVPRSSDVDFDKVPSPRPSASSTLSRRVSLAKSNGAGPSSLSRASIPEEPASAMDHGGMDDIGYDPDDLPPSDDLGGALSPDQAPRHTSFTQMDQDDDEEEQDMMSPAKRPRESSPTDSRQNALKRARQHSVVPNGTASTDRENNRTSSAAFARKGKRSRLEEDDQEQDQQEQDPGMEDEIARGLEEVENMPLDEEEEEEPPTKKAREKPKKPRARHTELVSSPSRHEDGKRRSRRMRYKPLEYWRLEKVVYGRRDSGITYVPHIKEIIRLPREHVEPLGAKKRRRKPAIKERSKTATVEPEPEPEVVEPEVVIDHNPEEGWDNETEPLGTVVDYVSRKEVERRLAFTSSMLQPRAAANNDFFFQRVFGDNDFMAAGQLLIPPKKSKPSKATKDNTYVFYVIEGAVNFKVHKTSFLVATGGMFLVPRGNMYLIENICERDAKLFFAQARKVPSEEEPLPLSHPSPSNRRSLGPGAAPSPRERRSSGGPAPPDPGSVPGSTSDGDRAREGKTDKAAKRSVSRKI